MTCFLHKIVQLGCVGCKAGVDGLQKLELAHLGLNKGWHPEARVLSPVTLPSFWSRLGGKRVG